MILSTTEEQGDFVTRLLEQEADKLDSIVKSWGMSQELPVRDARLCALAVQQLGLSGEGTATPCDDATLFRRSGLPVVAVSFRTSCNN